LESSTIIKERGNIYGTGKLLTLEENAKGIFTIAMEIMKRKIEKF
jgi:hypothetical protein